MVPETVERIVAIRTLAQCTIGTFVTDNTSNMAGLRRELLDLQVAQIDKCQADYNTCAPDLKVPKFAELQDARELLLLDVYGCSAHLLNLIGKDVCDGTIISNVLTICKYWHGNGQMISAVFVIIQGCFCFAGDSI